MAGCHRIKQFAREHHLIWFDRPHALLWLAECYAIPTSMYACRIWGTQFHEDDQWVCQPPSNCAFVLCVKRICLTELCCKSVERGLCNFIGSALLPSFSSPFFAGVVACSRGLCMQILLSIFLRKVLDCGVHKGVSGSSASDRYTNC